MPVPTKLSALDKVLGLVALFALVVILRMAGR